MSGRNNRSTDPSSHKMTSQRSSNFKLSNELEEAASSKVTIKNNKNQYNIKWQTEVTGKKTAKAKRKVLLMGDSHICRIDKSNVLNKSILASGFGGLKSNQVIFRHKQSINSNIQSVDEVAIHVGSNDVWELMKR